MDIAIVTDCSGNTGALHVRGVPTFLLYLLKDAARQEGVTLRRYVIQVLAMVVSGGFGDVELDFRD